MKKGSLLCVLFLISIIAMAQPKNYWNAIDGSRIPQNVFEGRYKPQAYNLFQLNAQMMVSQITDRMNHGSEFFTIQVPNADGVMEQYKSRESSIMDPMLAARYPGIKSYVGQGITDPTSVMYFDISPRGFHAMILSSNRHTIYIDPLTRNQDYYIVFSRQDAADRLSGFQCHTLSAGQPAIMDVPTDGLRGADDGKLRTYRLALACTGEYGQYFLDGTETSDAQRKSKVLSAMVTLMTRTNGIYERDFGIHMNLIANNDAIIYLNGSTDPWASEWNSKTQQTIDAVIGSSNYDIGHLVHKESSSSNNNGNAGCIGCICKAGQKGSAFTSHVSPEGDPFIVDYTTHEMGHQFGANHTFTFSNESGTASQFEPGSGSTIMGYAGITGSTDVQPHSDDYFHTRSIEQVTLYIKGTTGGGCAVTTTTGNATPTANAGTAYTIPKSTPFALTGIGTDADGADILTYTWEQVNAGTSSTTVPSATATSGPVFRSRNNGTNPVRTFPIISSILDGTNGNTWEKLPSVARALTFRLTVRDNHPGGGNNQTSDATITISSATGPFAVTAPNSAVSWPGGTTQTITWSVAGTTGAPVNCANVKISLSTNGGLSFNTVLVSSTPNDGSEVLTIPAIQTSQARIKVEAVGNIFFDISNTNFSITGTTGCNVPTGLTPSGITNNSATVSWTAVSGALSYDVDYKTASAGTWNVAVAGTTSLSVNLSGLTAGTVYDWRLRSNCSGSSSAYAQAQFTTTSPAVCNAPTGLNSSSVTSSASTLNWSAVSGASNYSVEYKTASSSTWINATTSTTSLSISISGLLASTLYDWRVRSNCPAAVSSYAIAQFTTAAGPAACVNAYEANQTQATASSIPLNTSVSAAISSTTDIDYYKVTTTVTSNFTVTLTNLPADYDLYMYNSAGTQIGNSTAGNTSNETISLSGRAAGIYYFRVIGYNSVFSTSVCYNLNVTATAATGCQSAYDVSANGTTAGAATIPFNTNIMGLISPSADVDYYKFVISNTGTITITLGTLPGDYDLKLLNGAGTQVAISQNGNASNESITYNATPGTYYAQVYGYNGANSASVCYTLKVQLGTASRQEHVDTDIAIEYFSIYPNPASDVLNINESTARFTKKIIEITDAKGIVLLKQELRTNRQAISISFLRPGVYFLRLTGNKKSTLLKFVKL